jgi:hypothetical protein
LPGLAYGFLVAFGAGFVDFIDFIDEDFVDEDFIDEDFIDEDFIDFAEALVAVFGAGVAFEAAIAVPVIRNPAARSAASILFIGTPPSVANSQERRRVVIPVRIFNATFSKRSASAKSSQLRWVALL